MKSEFKKEYIAIVIVVVLAAAILYYWSNRHPIPFVINEPATPLVLDSEDFVLKNSLGSIKVGSSSYEDVVACYPKGKNLGLSTLYRPEGKSLLFEFGKKDNLLIVAHIEEAGLSTYRGIALGDSLDKVETAYGPLYTSVGTGQDENVDIVYGKGNKIVFKIIDHKVSKIVVQHDAVTI